MIAGKGLGLASLVGLNAALGNRSFFDLDKRLARGPVQNVEITLLAGDQDCGNLPLRAFKIEQGRLGA